MGHVDNIEITIDEDEYIKLRDYLEGLGVGETPTIKLEPEGISIDVVESEPTQAEPDPLTKARGTFPELDPDLSLDDARKEIIKLRNNLKLAGAVGQQAITQVARLQAENTGHLQDQCSVLIGLEELKADAEELAEATRRVERENAQLRAESTRYRLMSEHRQQIIEQLRSWQRQEVEDVTKEVQAELDAKAVGGIIQQTQQQEGRRGFLKRWRQG